MTGFRLVPGLSKSFCEQTIAFENTRPRSIGDGEQLRLYCVLNDGTGISPYMNRPRSISVGPSVQHRQGSTNRMRQITKSTEKSR